MKTLRAIKLLLFGFFFFFNLFGAALDLCCGPWAFSSCSSRGSSLVALHGLLLAIASLVAKAWALCTKASVVAAQA